MKHTPAQYSKAWRWIRHSLNVSTSKSFKYIEREEIAWLIIFVRTLSLFLLLSLKNVSPNRIPRSFCTHPMHIQWHCATLFVDGGIHTLCQWRHYMAFRRNLKHTHFGVCVCVAEIYLKLLRMTLDNSSVKKKPYLIAHQIFR